MKKGSEIFDNYIFSEHKKIITADIHGVSGLGNLSHFDIASNDQTPLHFHSDIIEIFCFLKGQRTIQIEQNDMMREYTSFGNELMIIYPFELHKTSNLAKNRNEYYAIQLNIRQETTLLGLNKEYSNSLRQELLSLSCHRLKAQNSQITALRTAFNLFAYGNPKDIPFAVSHLVCFLLGLKYLEPIHDSLKRVGSDEFQKILTYVSKNIYNPLTLQELAHISGYSLSHFKVKFKECFGITPAEYITLQKISAAEKELLSSNISITELAYKLSFSSSNYFCTVFRKMLGYSPSEYRRLFQK